FSAEAGAGALASPATNTARVNAPQRRRRVKPVMIDLLSFLIAAPSSRRCADDGAFWHAAQAGRGATARLARGIGARASRPPPMSDFGSNGAGCADRISRAHGRRRRSAPALPRAG